MTVEIAVVFSAISVIITIATFFKNNKKEVRNDVTDIIELKTQLSYISRGIDDIKLADRTREKDIKQLNEGFVQLSYDVKDIYKTIERMDNEIHNIKSGGNAQ